MRVIIYRVFSMRGLNYRGILLRGFKSVIVKSITNCIVEIERLLKRPLRKFHEHESNKLPTN